MDTISKYCLCDQLICLNLCSIKDSFECFEIHFLESTSFHLVFNFLLSISYWKSFHLQNRKGLLNKDGSHECMACMSQGSNFSLLEEYSLIFILPVSIFKNLFNNLFLEKLHFLSLQNYPAYYLILCYLLKVLSYSCFSIAMVRLLASNLQTMIYFKICLCQLSSFQSRLGS